MPQLTVGTLKLFGGHVALDFANTVDSRGVRYGPDVLRSFDDLLTWAVRLAALEPGEATALRHQPPDRGVAALDRAKTLRETIYRIFATGAAPDRSDLDLLQREVCMAQESRTLIPIATVSGATGYLWRWHDNDPDTVTHRIASQAADLLTSSAVGRVRVCPGDNCSLLFLDRSRAGRRIWCSEETCGTRNRVRRWRAHRPVEV